MRRPMRLALIGLAASCTMPATSGAQVLRRPDEPPPPRLRLTPFAAYAPQFRRVETRTTEWPDRTVQYDAAADVGIGFGGGATVEYQGAGQLGAFGGGAIIRRRATMEQLPAGGTREVRGSDYMMLRGGLGMRFIRPRPDLQMHRLQAGLAAGPTWLRELPRAAGGAARPMNLWGLHVATSGELLLPDDRFAVSAALEDNVVWWNAGELARRVDDAHARRGEATLTTLRTGPSHHWLIRAGLTLRF